ncbi:complement receptor type 2-like isoform X2 [Oscarella lobularis]
MQCLKFSWRITSPTRKIQLNIRNFMLARGDFVKIYHGIGKSQPLIAAFTSGQVPREIVSSGQHMYVDLRTTCKVTERHFKAVFKTTEKLCDKLDYLPPHLLRERMIKSEKGRKIGAEFKFSCDPPYELKGSTKMKCIMKRGKTVWNPKILPTCICPVSCSLPVVKEFVQTSDTGRACQGENITYSCKDGAAVLRGDTNRTCKSDGSLSGQPLECDQCCLNPSPPNTIISWEKKRFCARNKLFYGDSSEIELACEDGYQTLNLNEGPFRLTCVGAEGKWRGSRPDCYYGCFRPLNPANGRIVETEERHDVGKYIHYECQAGFALQGHSKRKCLPEGKWSGPLPLCKNVSCTKLLAPLNGRIAKYDIDNITFSCFDGYDMIGADQLVCMPNGQWNGKAPRCIRNYGGCQVPKTVRLMSSRSCTKGVGRQIGDFSVDGRRVQSWKDCSVTCLKTISNGEIVFGTKNPRLWIGMRREYNVSSVTVYGVKEIRRDSIERFKLNDLKNLQHSGEITSIAGFEVHVSQNWHRPVAREDDEQRSKATRCGHRQDTLSKNTIYDVRCDDYIPGRYLSIHVPGNNRILSICEVDIFVKPYNKTCDEKKKYREHAMVTHCPDPGFIINGQRTPENDGRFDIGETVTYRCNLDFKLNGNNTIQCSADGTWKYDAFPQCSSTLLLQ